jgi:hypothetical protein
MKISIDALVFVMFKTVVKFKTIEANLNWLVNLRLRQISLYSLS